MKIKSITIIGREWQSRTYGTNYQKATVLVDGKKITETRKTSGYITSYIQDAAEELEALGLIPRRERNTIPFWSHCKDLGISLYTELITVARERDL